MPFSIPCLIIIIVFLQLFSKKGKIYAKFIWYTSLLYNLKNGAIHLTHASTMILNTFISQFLCVPDQPLSSPKVTNSLF